MSKFIKFTNYILNINSIHAIVIEPKKYIIRIISKKIDGVSWNAFGFGVGNISSYSSEIEVCETKHSIDYKILSDWINNIK